MKKILFIWFVLQIVPAIAQEQTIAATQISKEIVDADSYVGFDGYNNYYYTKNNILYKNSNGKLWQFKNLSLGKFTRVDLQNPLKIVVFYENFNMVILLDNQLNDIQKVQFSLYNTPLVVTAFGIASQNKLWMYNSLTQQIGLYDYINNTYEILTAPFKGGIKYYESDFNYFQWVDEKLNWFSCDIYGKITALGKVPEFDQLQTVNNKQVFFLKNGNLYLFDVPKNITYTISNVENSFKKFYYKDQILSIFTNEGITNYKIKTP